MLLDSGKVLKVKVLVTQSCPTLCDPWTVARPLQTLWTGQASLSMEFSRQEHWSGFPFPSPGDPYLSFLSQLYIHNLMLLDAGSVLTLFKSLLRDALLGASPLVIMSEELVEVPISGLEDGAHEPFQSTEQMYEEAEIMREKRQRQTLETNNS